MEIDLSGLDAKTRGKVDEIFRRDYDLKVMKAIRRQTALAARNQRDKERSLNGRGERTHEIDAVIDSIWRQFYGHDYSANQDLMKFLAKRNPEIRVLSGGTKMMTGWMPGAASKFRKTYAGNE